MIGKFRKTAIGAAGFTLIEILVVLAIVSAAALVIVRSGATSKRVPTLTEQARAVAHLASLASLEARTKRRSVQMEVDLKNQTIGFGTTADEQILLPDTTKIGLLTGQELVRSDSNGIILFLSNGGSTGGEIMLSGVDERMVPQTVSVHWLTGVVKIIEGADASNASR